MDSWNFSYKEPHVFHCEIYRMGGNVYSSTPLPLNIKQSRAVCVGIQ